MTPLSPNLTWRRGRRREGTAHGTFDNGSDEPKTSIHWPLPMFHTINRLARENQVSFSQQVRELCAQAINSRRGV